MSLEVGAIVEGEVTGITNFGAFVQLPEGRLVLFIYPKFLMYM